MGSRKRERASAPARVPAAMVASVAGYQWARNTVGEAGAAVYRLHGKAGAPDLFLKHGKDAVADDIGAEAARLRWLAAHMPVPAVRQFERSGNRAWLLMTAIPGETAFERLDAAPDDRPAIVDALAAFLRRLHAIPITACPFSSAHPARLAAGRARIDTGQVDTDDFDAERAGWTAEQVWTALQALLPLAPDFVVTHGDYSLDNILIVDGEVAGCIDVGRAGSADRWQDLAIIWNCIGEFGAALQDRFLQSYGLTALDRRKCDFHLLLDELF